MFVADGTGANPRQILVAEPGVHNHFPVWSLDGRWIYFAQGRPDALEMDLYRIAPAGGAPERLTEHNGDVAYPAPIDPRTLIYVARDEDRSGPWLWSLDVERKVTRRATFGLEKYTSVSASADGRHLVATVANPTATLWSVPILDRIAEERDVKPFPVPAVRAWAPRFGGGSLFYLSSRGTGDGLWSFRDGEAFEIWRGSEGALREPPAISRDGRRAALVHRQRGKSHLNLVSTDGAEQRSVAEQIDVQGSAAWSPDGSWIATGGIGAEGPGLFKVPVDGGTPVRIVAGPAFNPVWSPDGNLIAYSGQQVGTFHALLAVRPDGSPIPLPAIQLSIGGRCRFLPDGKGLVYQGSLDFWLLDLITNETHQLTALSNPVTTRTFDITPDGSQIIFDRLRENSDIVLIDLPGPD
jgi:Tol biopolymer transport system component